MLQTQEYQIQYLDRNILQNNGHHLLLTTPKTSNNNLPTNLR